MKVYKSLVGEVKPVYKPKEFPKKKITSSYDSYDEIKKRFDPDQIDYRESFMILLLNRANNVIGHAWISTCGASGTLVDPKIVFQIALISNASSMILAHNHPSQNKRPSEADRKITRQLVDGGKLLEILVLDHLIITSEGYCSFADEGMI